MLSSLVLAICLFTLPRTETKSVGNGVGNGRPIIGAMTQAVTSPDQMKYGNIYLPANYVKYLESAGARVVPVLINQTDDYYVTLYQSLNGILFPGGGAVEGVLLKTGLGKAATMFYDNSIKGYDSSGDIFPLWGTCEGFQLLTMLTSQKDLLTNTDTEDKAFTLTLSSDYKNSRMFGTMPDDILHILTMENVTYNAHHWSITPKNFSASSALKNFYRVISTNKDDHGVEFISTMEAFKYPVYGTQWHPEKNPFQWTSGHIPHDADAVRVAQHMANFFVQQARMSLHKFRSEDEEAQHLIYNMNPVNVGNIRDGNQYYFWTI